jgi:hypothetical protein
MIVEEHIGNDIFTLFKENALKNCPKRKWIYQAYADTF